MTNINKRFTPSVYGVGFLGEGEFKSTNKGKHTPAYSSWKSMLRRCYSANTPKCYTNVTVCKEWHNFQNFAAWFVENYIEGYHLDKDIKQPNNTHKVYSPEVCVYISLEENASLAGKKTKHHIFRNPEGKLVDIYNLAEYCRHTTLDRSAMSKVARGLASHHKGWTKP